MRKTLLLFIAAILVLYAGELHAQELRGKQPNVLLILADDLGFSDLGCYGGEIRTTNLDALAKGGLRYSQAYNTSRCWPSRAALMTGYYAQQVRRDSVPGIVSGSAGVRPKWAPLVSEILHAKGYRAYHSGKWHIDGKPLQLGFDHSYDVGGGGQNQYFSARGVLEDDRPTSSTDEFYVTTGIADHAVRCLREHHEQFAEQPFFHYVCFTSPHFPLHARAEDIAQYKDVYHEGWDVVRKRRVEKMKREGFEVHPVPNMERDVGPPYAFPDAIKQLGEGEVNRPIPWTELNDEQQTFQANKMAIHAAMVDRMDQEIGRIVEQLKAMNVFDDTLIVFASDNGASAEMMVRGDGHDPTAPPGSAKSYLCLGPGWSSVANTPFRRHKTWTHEGGTATPLIVHWPAKIAVRGEWRTAPTHLIDIMPTILDVVDIVAPAASDGAEKIPLRPGKSLRPSFASAHPIERECLWWLHEGNRAIRVGDWKLVAANKQPWELYDLSVDRGEIINLATANPERVLELSKLWERKWDEFAADAKRDANPVKP